MMLILGGTSETHEYIQKHSPSGFIITLATPYGFDAFRKRYGANVIYKRFNTDTLRDFILENKVTEIIDTTHPFALEITDAAIKAAENAGIKYTDKMRIIDFRQDDNSLIKMFENFDDAEKYLSENEFENILFTIGSKEIHRFKNHTEKAWVRVLPYADSIQKCLDAGVDASRIIAMQGPFSKEFNVLIINEKKISCVVTKATGSKGGFNEKLSACEETGTPIIVITPT